MNSLFGLISAAVGVLFVLGGIVFYLFDGYVFLDLLSSYINWNTVLCIILFLLSFIVVGIMEHQLTKYYNKIDKK